jgi:hypothetical protein
MIHTTVETLSKDAVGTLGLRRGDGAGGSETSRKSESSERFDRHFENGSVEAQLILNE